MRIRPTELGLKGILLLAALELAFLATAYSNLFFLLLVFCCALGALGMIGAATNLRGLDLQVGLVPLAPADAPRSITVAIRGGRRRFDLALALEAGRRRIELGHVPRSDGAENHRLEMAGQPRGMVHATRLRVASRHPFGLFEVVRRLPASVEVATHPAPLPASPAGAAPDERETGASAGGAGAAVAGLRPFRPGDSLCSVHWKATARRGEPIVKEREAETATRRDVVLDRRCDPDALETALREIAMHVLDAAGGGHPLRLRSQDCTLDVGAAAGQGATALRWLAGANVLAPTAPDVPIGAGSRCLPARPGKESARA